MLILCGRPLLPLDRLAASRYLCPSKTATTTDTIPMCHQPKTSTRPQTDVSRPCLSAGASHDQVDIGDVVRANLLRLRQARSLSLQELAELAGVSPAALEDLATARSFPGVELLWKLARALDLPCTVFVEEPVVVSPASPLRASRAA
jgi:ribosome-binding protein aMBF1 (putative translation factor)